MLVDAGMHAAAVAGSNNFKYYTPRHVLCTCVSGALSTTSLEHSVL